MAKAFLVSIQSTRAFEVFGLFKRPIS